MTPTKPFTFKTTSYPDARGTFTPIPLFDAPSQLDFRPLQFNVSVSKPNVVRGMHWQGSHPQAKLIAVLSGSILDVVVDIKFGRKTGETDCFILRGGDKNDGVVDMLYVPRGYAHGFRSSPEGATVLYAVDALYDPSDERGFSPFDISAFGDMSNCTLSEKDKNWPRLHEIFPDIEPRVFPLDSEKPSMVQ